MIENASRWWSDEVASEERWRYVRDYIRAIENAQWDMTERALKYTWLYDRNAKLVGVGGALRQMGSGDPSTENIVRNNIETATALLGNEMTRVAALTDGAEWSVQRRAKRLEKFLEAQFQRLAWDKKQVGMVRGGAKNGNGYVKFFIEDGEICASSCTFDEIIVDDESCPDGEPAQMCQRRFVDKDVLKARFPDFADEIDLAHVKDSIYVRNRKVIPGQIIVWETWRKPAKKGAKDGRHTLCVEGATLFDERWKYDWFPFVIFRWVDREGRFYGCGLAEELASYQNAVNKTNANIQKSHSLFGNQRIFVHVSDKEMNLKMDDDMSSLVVYKNKPPIVPDWQAVKPEVYKYKEQLKTDAQKYSGVPDMAARSMKPVGLDSGAALREWTDITASRMTTQKAEIERIKMQAAVLILALAKELYGRNQDVQTFWHSRNLAKKIKWSEVNLDEDMYVLRLEPASMMSRTPAGARQGVIDLAATGALEPDAILRLAGIPDVQRELDLKTAAIEDIEAEIEELCDGKWSPPEPFMDLAGGISRMQNARNKARRDGAPPDILNLFTMWMVRAKALMPTAQAPQANQVAAVPFQAGVAAPAGVVGAAPGAPPTGAPGAPTNGVAAAA